MSKKFFATDKDLIKEIMSKEDIDESKANRIMDTVFNSLKELIKNKGGITIYNFGNFKKKHIKAGERQIGNKIVEIHEHDTIRFKASKNSLR